MLAWPPEHTLPFPTGPWRVVSGDPHPEDDWAQAAYRLKDEADGRMVVPMSEEAVLPAAWVNSCNRHLTGLTLARAQDTVDSLSMRSALEYARIPQPAWTCRPSGRRRYRSTPPGYGVTRLAASVRSSGVIVHGKSTNWPDSASRPVERLEYFCGRRVYERMYEKYIDGEQYEVTGIIHTNRAAVPMAVLHQEWDRPAGKVLQYQPVTGTWLKHHLEMIAGAAVHALGIRGCGYCVEIRGAPGRWCVVEVNARLGEELQFPFKYDQLLHKSGMPHLFMAEELEAQLS